MSKELIDRLKSYIPSGDGHNSQYANDLADAVAILEAKAAPVGERDDDRAAIHQLAFELGGTEGGEYLLDIDDLNAVIDAAHQRQQGEYGDAYQGSREDLAIWKRRALEAEARVRQQDQIIDQMGEDLNAINGPTFMGEPVLPRQQAREVVMPDVSAMAKVLSDRAADACNINRDDNWAIYGQEYIDDVQAMLEVARLNKGAGSHE